MDDADEQNGDEPDIVLRALLVSVLCSLLGFMLLMIWGSNGRASSDSALGLAAGVIGFGLLLPTMLLGFLIEIIGDAIGGSTDGSGAMVLAIVAQFCWYYAVVWVATNVPFRFSLRTMFVATTLATAMLGIIVWLMRRY